MAIVSRKITACTLDCPDSCSLLVLRDDAGTVHVRGNPDHPFTRGFTCSKASRFLERLQSPRRITTPLRRRGGEWRRIGWEEALDLCAEQIQANRAEPASILHFHGEGAKGVLKQAGKLFFRLLGSSEVRGSLCDAAGYLACVADFGSRDNNDPEELLHARRIVNWGRDLSRSSVHTAALVRQARRGGTRVLTVSPGGDGNGSFSDEFIRVRPGTDRFLAAAVLHRMIERQAIKDEVLAHAHNWSDFRQVLLERPRREVMAACEVCEEDVERLAAFYSEAGPVATLIGAGLQRYTYGGENVRFINALAFLSGNVGCAGGGVYFHLHSLRNVNTMWVRGTEPAPRRTLLMPAIGREILEAKDPPIRMIWVNGSNVVNQAPDSHGVAQAFAKTPFKVVVDAFMTDTARCADLFLPCALLLEQEDIEASYLHNYVHHVQAVFNPPGEARTDYEILAELGKRLDPPVHLPEPETILRASLDSPVLDVTLEELRERGFVRARRRRVAYAGMRFDHKDGRYRFPPALHDEPDLPPDYPLRLLTLIRRDRMHSQIPEEEQHSPPTVWVAPDNPLLPRLRLDAPVFLISPLGRLRVRVERMPGLHPSVVIYRRGDWMQCGGGVNQLIAAGLTDMGRGAPFYQQGVSLENG